MLTSEQIGPLLTVKQVSELLHVHRNTVRRWSDRGVLTAYRISSRGDRRFRKYDIDQFLFRLASSKGYMINRDKLAVCDRSIFSV